MRITQRANTRLGFTLIEILVVVAIIGIVTVIALPAVYNALNGRQVTDAARIFTGSLVGIRDSAIRYNEPRGIRLIPDPTLTIPAPGQPGAGSLQLCYNRMIPIEPAGDYNQGMVTIGPQYYVGGAPTDFPPYYPIIDPNVGSYARYPFPDSSGTASVLMIEESPFDGGFTTTSPAQPNAPTNWYWNIRVGDKIRINGTGRAYTIVGPCTINPWAAAASGNQGNPEMFVNVGPPGTQSPLYRAYYTQTAAGGPWVVNANRYPEFLFLVNGEDDDNDGYVDEGWDGYNQNPSPPVDANHNLVADEVAEWEPEKWVGSLTSDGLLDNPTGTPAGSPSAEWVDANFQKGTQNVSYIIERRPVPSPGAREIQLPAGMVIDATTWNTTRERSRIPIQLGSLHCDVMVNPNGLYIPTTQYSTPTSADPVPFLHFWITSKDDVYPRGTVWGLDGSGVPNHNSGDPDTSAGAPYVCYELPLPSDAMGLSGGVVAAPTQPGAFYPATQTNLPVLKNDRRLVTMFTQNGLVTTNTIESVPPTSTLIPGEGFSTSSVGYPFLKAQLGLREAR